MTTRSKPAAVPVPTSTLFAAFGERHPHLVNADAIAARWWNAVQLVSAGAVGAPDATGARSVLSIREPGTVYTVARISAPAGQARRYSCTCPDYTGIHKADFCKHVLAVWQVVLAQHEQQQAHAVLAELLKADHGGFLALLTAIRHNDSDQAANTAAQLAASFAPIPPSGPAPSAAWAQHPDNPRNEVTAAIASIAA